MLHYLHMAVIRDPTDPRSTKRLLKDPIVESTHIFRLVIIIERSSKVYLPLDICPNNAYRIFSLFFNNAVLAVLVKSCYATPAIT